MQNDNPYEAPKSDIGFFDQVEQQNLSQLYASRGSRFGAAILDTIFLIIPLLIIFFMLGITEFISTGETSSAFLSLILETQSNLFVEMLVSSALAFGLFVLIQGYWIYTSSQTLGKKILGMKVVDLEGRPISGNHYLFVRYLPMSVLSYLPIVGGLIAIVDCLMIFREEHNCLHDDIAKTRVIKVS